MKTKKRQTLFLLFILTSACLHAGESGGKRDFMNSAHGNGATFFTGQGDVVPLPAKTPRGQVTPLKPAEAKIKKVMAEGQGKIINGNIDKARQAALRTAYAEAVQRGCGLAIGSLTMIKNVKYVSDIVASRSRGFIKNYTVIREGVSTRDKSLYEVAISADVVEENYAKEEDEKEGLKLYIEILGNPKLLIILPEKSYASQGTVSIQQGQTQRTQIEYQKGQTRVQISQEEGKKIAADTIGMHDPAEDGMMRSTEAALAQAFSQYGYQVVTSDDLIAQGLCSANTMAEAKSGKTASALQVARASGADLSLFGVIRLAKEQIHPADMDMFMVTAEASAKAMVVSSGKVIDAFHKTHRASHPQQLKAYADCLDRVAGDIAGILAWKIPQILANEYRVTQLRLNGINSRQVMAVQSALADCDGIEQVNVTQLPTQTVHYANYNILSGFITLDPLEITAVCGRALSGNVKIIKANKFELELSK
jgi:hypothetical protein